MEVVTVRENYRYKDTASERRNPVCFGEKTLNFLEMYSLISVRWVSGPHLACTENQGFLQVPYLPNHMTVPILSIYNGQFYMHRMLFC
jgi:hypothetical protein